MTKLTGLALALVLWVSFPESCAAQVAPVSKPRPPSPTVKVCSRCIRAHMEFLASDALNGRGSATHDELVAATYVATQLRAFGIDPAGDEGGYLQQAVILKQKLTGQPQIIATQPDKNPVTLTYGEQC